MSSREACADALVIGGGPSGCAAAILLRQAGWSVVLLERSPFPRAKVCGEYVSATNFALLERLGVWEEFRAAAGPPVERIGLFVGESQVVTRSPGQGGRALSRQRLDVLLLERARRLGVDVRQPCAALGLTAAAGGYLCEARDRAGAPATVRAPVVLAAHNFWAPGPLPTQPARAAPRRSDLFAFKAHFVGAALPPDLMPLLSFPGGYGGMVRCEGGRVTLSCCVRRDVLVLLPGSFRGGQAVLEHIARSCRGAREALAGGQLESPWLGAGPIRPGARRAARGGVFAIGNAAGEAHPVIAEGLSMALQSAWLAARELIARPGPPPGRAELRACGARYAAAWRRLFAPRLLASCVIAHWAMRPALWAPLVPLLRLCPALLVCGARLAGKAMPPPGLGRRDTA